MTGNPNVAGNLVSVNELCRAPGSGPEILTKLFWQNNRKDAHYNHCWSVMICSDDLQWSASISADLQWQWSDVWRVFCSQVSEQAQLLQWYAALNICLINHQLLIIANQQWIIIYHLSSSEFTTWSKLESYSWNLPSFTWIGTLTHLMSMIARYSTHPSKGRHSVPCLLFL